MKSNQAGLEEADFSIVHGFPWSSVHHCTSEQCSLSCWSAKSQFSLKWKFWAQTKQKIGTKPSVSSRHNRNWLKFVFLNMQNGTLKMLPKIHLTTVQASLAQTFPVAFLFLRLWYSALMQCRWIHSFSFVPTVLIGFPSGASLWTVPNLSRKAKPSHSL